MITTRSRSRLVDGVPQLEEAVPPREPDVATLLARQPVACPVTHDRPELGVRAGDEQLQLLHVEPGRQVVLDDPVLEEGHPPRRTIEELREADRCADRVIHVRRDYPRAAEHEQRPAPGPVGDEPLHPGLAEPAPRIRVLLHDEPGIDIRPVGAHVVEEALGVVVGRIDAVYEHPGAPVAPPDGAERGHANGCAAGPRDRRAKPGAGTEPSAQPSTLTHGPGRHVAHATARASGRPPARDRVRRVRAGVRRPDRKRDAVERELEIAASREPQEALGHHLTAEAGHRHRLRPGRLGGAPVDPDGLGRWRSAAVVLDPFECHLVVEPRP